MSNLFQHRLENDDWSFEEIRFYEVHLGIGCQSPRSLIALLSLGRIHSARIKIPRMCTPAPIFFEYDR